MTAVIVAEGLGKDYRAQASWRDLARGRLRGPVVRALESVDLEVGAGEIVALMGENGAGKSTLLRTLGGLVAPTRGKGRVAGHDLAAAGAGLRRDAVYVSGDARSFAWRLSVRANLEFFAALHGHDRAGARARVGEVLGRVELDTHAERPVGELSTGLRQRLALARGLIGAPRAWLLDEPTAGLDPAAARRVRALIAGLATAGGAVVLCTHALDEARALASRVVVLAAGRVRAAGGVEEAERVFAA